MRRVEGFRFLSSGLSLDRTFEETKKVSSKGECCDVISAYLPSTLFHKDVH